MNVLVRVVLVGLLLVAGGGLSPSTTSAAVAATDDQAIAATGYHIVEPGIVRYFADHGGVPSLGLPISNSFVLMGNRVQLFQRQAVEMRADGTVDTLNLVDGSYFPLARLGGVSLAPDPQLLARLPAVGTADYQDRAADYLRTTAPDQWNGLPVGFASKYSSNVRCPDDGGRAVCTAQRRFGLAVELWGLPIAQPSPDPRSPDYVYLWFQRGVLVYSQAARESQWLLVGDVFKRVLTGSDLPQDMLTQISTNPAYARFYAQYDPLAPSGVARPAELPDTVLGGAFPAAAPAAPALPAPPTVTASPTPSAAPATPSTTRSTPSVPSTATRAAAPVPSGLDPRFGVAEAFRAPEVMVDLHVGWERLVVPWDQVQPDAPSDFTHLGLTLSADRLSADVARGVRVAAVLQFTPTWAQTNPTAGLRSVPRNLNLPFDDPANYWGQFVYETVKHYRGQINEWIVWNEPEFRPTDSGAGGGYNWAGTDEEFAQLLRVAYLAAKRASPDAVVSFPATSYWIEEVSRPKRTPFYERELSLLSRDPHAAEHGYYHDALSINLYRSGDDIYRVHQILSTAQHAYNIDKPIWLTEMNAMPSDDALTQCPALDSPFKTSLDQQAAYAMQSFALAAAAGFQRAEFYKMVDGDGCREPAWGMVRANGTPRPVVDAARTAITYFSNYTTARFLPLVRDHEAWPAWPTNPASYLPNWQVYQVALDRPGNQRVTAVWNGDDVALRVRIARNGSSARLIDRTGVARTPREDSGAWLVDLPPATAHSSADEPNKDPDGYHVIGGDVQLLVEEGVDPSRPLLPVQLSNS